MSLGSGVSYIPNPKGITSTLNSTSTPLGVSLNYTGTGELNQLPYVGVTCFSDVEGQVYFEFSPDNTNWTRRPALGYQVMPNSELFVTGEKMSRYFRVVFEKDATSQAVFRLNTYFGDFPIKTIGSNEVVTQDADTILTRDTLNWLDVSRGLYDNIESIKIGGRNTAVGTTTPSPLAPGGIYRTPQAASATTLRIKSGGNANDTAGGSGARSVRLTGLDQNWNLVTEDLATAGASASASTTTTFTRLLKAEVLTSGAYPTFGGNGSHDGNIVIENTAGTQDWTTIRYANNLGRGIAEIGCYTVPVGYTGYVRVTDASAETGKTVNIYFAYRPNCDEAAAPYSPMIVDSRGIGLAGGGVYAFGPTDVPKGPFVGPCDVGFLALAITTAASVNVEFELFLVKNN